VVRRGKRRQRLRLLAFAVPLKKANASWIPETHGSCEQEPCVECKAALYLTADDREIMTFYEAVADQTVNLTPNGAPNGGAALLAPRLEGWVSACDLYGVPPFLRKTYVEMARLVFDGVQGRVSVHGLHKIKLEELEPPPFPVMYE
jgi:hypothetical protein